MVVAAVGVLEPKDLAAVPAEQPTSTPSTLAPSSPTAAQRTLERQIVALVVSVAASEPVHVCGHQGYRRDVRLAVPAGESCSGHPGPVSAAVAQAAALGMRMSNWYASLRGLRLGVWPAV